MSSEHARPSRPEPGGGAVVLPLPRLRAATPGDAAEIVRLLSAVALEGTLGLDPGGLRVEEEAARLARLDLRAACALVVVVRGSVQAFAVGVRGAEPAIAHTASVSLAVSPEHRRSGLGRLLLGGVLAWADAAGVRKLVAGVCDRNSAALALFHRSGYAVEGVRRQQIHTGAGLADEVLFGLLLAAARPGALGTPTRPGGRAAAHRRRRR